jgi:glutamine amidotransferase
VHSYHPNIKLPYATTTYGSQTFPSIIGNGSNLIATQYHLEKSGNVGLKMLENFSNLAM